MPPTDEVHEIADALGEDVSKQAAEPEFIKMMKVPTEDLEKELRELSERLESDRLRFANVKDELASRRFVARETKVDDQPPPKLRTTEDVLREQLEDAQRTINGLTNKVISMEAEQAKLVIEAELAKAETRETKDRLALVAKHASANTEQEEKNG